jgi:peptidoglycan-associated lipoprotein
MKLTRTLAALSLIAVLALGATGCKRTPKDITPIHGRTAKTPTGPGPGDMIDGGANKLPGDGVTSGGLATAGLEEFEGMLADRSVFASETVYFDFDRSAVRNGERAKADNVAAYLKSHADDKLLIEGHCDERGTEEYNRSLGEKRALALREYLVRAGIAPNRIQTRSFGEDRPAVLASNDAAWAKNRRGEFILLRPKP